MNDEKIEDALEILIEEVEAEPDEEKKEDMLAGIGIIFEALENEEGEEEIVEPEEEIK